MAFFIISLLILIMVHTYIGIRIINPFHLSHFFKYFLWGLLIIMLLSPFLPVLARFAGLNKSIESILGWIGYSWLGFVSIIFLLILFRDIGWGMGTGTQKIYRLFTKTNAIAASTENPVNQERRQFIVQSMNLGLLGISLLGTGYGFYEARRKAAVINIDIPLKNLPHEFHGFKIVQFSDLHVGPTIKKDFVQTVANQIKSLNADLIIFTGDLVDGSVENLRNEVASIKNLAAPFGKYFVTGNHEYYSNALEWCEEAQNLGFQVLINENTTITKGNSKIMIAGVTDFSAGNYIQGHKSDPRIALKSAEHCSTKILLAHQPRSIFEAAKAGYDLQISGHTHGGQLIPWQYLTRLAQPYMSGLHKHENTWIYINQGTGYWGPPLRIGARSEITVLRLIKQV